MAKLWISVGSCRSLVKIIPQPNLTPTNIMSSGNLLPSSVLDMDTVYKGIVTAGKGFVWFHDWWYTVGLWYSDSNRNVIQTNFKWKHCAINNINTVMQ